MKHRQSDAKPRLPSFLIFSPHFYKSTILLSMHQGLPSLELTSEKTQKKRCTCANRIPVNHQTMQKQIKIV